MSFLKLNIYMCIEPIFMSYVGVYVIYSYIIYMCICNLLHISSYFQPHGLLWLWATAVTYY